MVCVVCVVLLVVKLRAAFVCVEAFGRVLVSFRRVDLSLVVVLLVAVIAVAVIPLVVWKRFCSNAPEPGASCISGSTTEVVGGKIDGGRSGVVPTGVGAVASNVGAKVFKFVGASVVEPVFDPLEAGPAVEEVVLKWSTGFGWTPMSILSVESGRGYRNSLGHDAAARKTSPPLKK